MSSRRRVHLTSQQLRYLASASYLSKSLRGCVSRVLTSPEGQSSLDIDPRLAEEFRSAFTDRLAAVGFDASYDLNEEGKLLEDLIDAFNA
jgi:hypothetical protein